MSHPVKRLRTNMMYWRFRYVTRNRIKLQAWWNRRRHPRPGAVRPRGGAAIVYRHTARRTWIALVSMVGLLTALSVAIDQGFSINSYLAYGVKWGIIIGAVYWALQRL
jgi:hypothetical protein